ncbi:MAG TPA: NAD-binding protein [Gemmataceae bacterium]|jgi:thioredoxin reductase|nr:NAD-binding protein [Gemmataceae bacterium]
MPRIAVLGAGPIGLEAAAQAVHLGHPVTVYERGDVAEALGQWGHVRLFTPFGMNSTPLGLDLIREEHPQHQLPGPNDLLTGLEYRDAYLVPLTLTAKLADAVKTRTFVVTVGRSGVLKTDGPTDPKRIAAPFRLLLRDDKGAERFEEADVVLDCTGTYGRHAWLGDGGIPAAGEIAAEKQISYGLDDVLGRRKAQYAGKSVIVVGGGYSAATTVCALAQLAEENAATWVIWLTRGPRSTPLQRNPNDPLRERDRLAAKANNLAARGDGNVEYRAQILLDEVTSHGPDKGFRVCGRCNGKPMTWEVDRVIGNVGYLADSNLTRELHISEFANGSVRQPEPGYFVLGMKSFGRDSNFLLKRGFEQVKEVLALVSKRA